jgi:predicted nucleic acid-binding Zn ribbon protein
MATKGKERLSDVEAAKAGHEFGLAPLKWARCPAGYELTDAGRNVRRRSNELVWYSLGDDLAAHARWRRGDGDRPKAATAHLDFIRAFHERSELGLPPRDVVIPDDASPEAREELERYAAEVSGEDLALFLVDRWGYLESPEAESEPVDRILGHVERLHHFDTALYFSALDEEGNEVDPGLRADAPPAKHAAAAAKAFNAHSGRAPLALDLRIEGDRVLAAPRTLADWIWAQLALDLAHGTRYRGCKVCGTPMPVRAEDLRTWRKETCSDACRMKLLRRRKAATHLTAATAGGGSAGPGKSKGGR